jgi:hypothetical protein
MGYSIMIPSNNKSKGKAIKGQDFKEPKDKEEKPLSHGEVENSKTGDFTELEESRMDNPPKKRISNEGK